MIAGTLLGTAIITGSLIVGDTIDRSIRAGAYEQLGPIDETISVSGLDDGATLTDALDDFSHRRHRRRAGDDHRDGRRGRRRGSTADPARVRSSSRSTSTTRERFGGDPGDHRHRGRHAPRGTGRDHEDLADRIDVGPGDDDHRLRVRPAADRSPSTACCPARASPATGPPTPGGARTTCSSRPGRSNRTLHAARPATDPITGAAVEPPDVDRSRSRTSAGWRPAPTAPTRVTGAARPGARRRGHRRAGRAGQARAHRRGGRRARRRSASSTSPSACSRWRPASCCS